MCQVLSYKYKLYHVEEEESETFNNFCLCALDSSDRSRASFTIAAPDVGHYFLKIFALPEHELHENEGAIFNFLATIRVSFTKADMYRCLILRVEQVCLTFG